MKFDTRINLKDTPNIIIVELKYIILTCIFNISENFVNVVQVENVKLN